MAYHSVISIATATRGPPRASQKTNALFLEPVLRDGLRPAPPGGTLKRTLAASGSFSPAVIRALREIFSDIFGVTLTAPPSKSRPGRVHWKPALGSFACREGSLARSG